MSSPRIISVANSKGGVGKSVVSILLAVALAKDKNKKVLILDSDAQGSVAEMYAEERRDREEETAVEVEEIAPRKVATFLKRFGDDYDIIFIDVPRMTEQKKDQATVMLLYHCDSVLIPVIGSQVDLYSTIEFLNIVEEAAKDKQEMGEELKYYGFINRRNLRKFNDEAELIMRKNKLKMFKNSLHDLRIFTNPSFYTSILETAEGERRFSDFYKEFCRKFKIR